MKRNSDAFTRVICEYCPSGLPRDAGLMSLISGIGDLTMSECGARYSAHARGGGHPARHVSLALLPWVPACAGTSGIDLLHHDAARFDRGRPLLDLTFHERAEILGAPPIGSYDRSADALQALLDRWRIHRRDCGVVEFLDNISRRALR